MNFFGSKNDMNEWLKNQDIDNNTIYLLDLTTAFRVATAIFRL